MEKVGRFAHRATMVFPMRDGGYHNERTGFTMSVYDVLRESWCLDTGHDLTMFLVQAKILAKDEADNIGIRVVLKPRTKYHDDFEFILSSRSSRATASFSGTLIQARDGKLITRTNNSKWATALRKMTRDATQRVAYSSNASGAERILATAIMSHAEALQDLQHSVQALQHESKVQQGQITESDAKMQALQHESEVQQGQIDHSAAKTLLLGSSVRALEQTLTEWKGGQCRGRCSSDRRASKKCTAAPIHPPIVSIAKLYNSSDGIFPAYTNSQGPSRR